MYILWSCLPPSGFSGNKCKIQTGEVQPVEMQSISWAHLLKKKRGGSWTGPGMVLVEQAREALASLLENSGISSASEATHLSHNAGYPKKGLFTARRRCTEAGPQGTIRQELSVDHTPDAWAQVCLWKGSEWHICTFITLANPIRTQQPSSCSNPVHRRMCYWPVMHVFAHHGSHLEHQGAYARKWDVIFSGWVPRTQLLNQRAGKSRPRCCPLQSPEQTEGFWVSWFHNEQPLLLIPLCIINIIFKTLGYMALESPLPGPSFSHWPYWICVMYQALVYHWSRVGNGSHKVTAIEIPMPSQRERLSKLNTEIDT
jgi:hypothetical protein